MAQRALSALATPPVTQRLVMSIIKKRVPAKHFGKRKTPKAIAKKKPLSLLKNIVAGVGNVTMKAQ